MDIRKLLYEKLNSNEALLNLLASNGIYTTYSEDAGSIIGFVKKAINAKVEKTGSYGKTILTRGLLILPIKWSLSQRD